MINRYMGNTGHVVRYEEKAVPPRPAAPAARQFSPVPHPQPRQNNGLLSSLSGLTKLLPGKAEELETEDIILLLILYLMYRESGDTELLIIMGAMFLL